MALHLVYKEVVDNRSKTSSHFQLVEGDTRGILSNYIRISNNRGYAKNSQPDYWLYEHDGKRFNRRATTGLFKTHLKGQIYSGDLQYKTHLILIERKSECVVVRVFVNHYPYSKSLHPSKVASMVKNV